MSTTLRRHDFAEYRLATLEVEQGHYLDFTALLALIPESNRESLWAIVTDNQQLFKIARGSTHNHQAWAGGYLDHICETMNIACQLYRTFSGLRRMEFELHEALEVMFLHDIEKPFAAILKAEGKYTKADRKQFRADTIAKYKIKLGEAQENALRYVEGVPDSEYTPNFRIMNELAAFCHCCDILSARMWWDRGANVPAPEWQ